MRVLQVTHNFHPVIGGIENYVLELCKSLKRQGIQSEVLCLDRHAVTGERLEREESFEGIKIHRIPFLNLKYYKLAPSLLGIAKGFDIIHVHNIGFFSDFLSLTKPLHKKRLVISTHGGFFHTKSLGALKKAYFHTLNRAALSAADCVICDSEHDFDIFSKTAKNAVLVNNGVAVEKFLKGRKRKEKNSMLFVGRLSKNKRVDKIISAAKELKNAGQNFKITIVGTDFEGILPSLERMRRESMLEKEIEIIAGPVPEKKLLKIYSRSEFFISASAYEGFGISAIEAMAAGCIPVLSDIDSFNQFVESGKNGFIIDFAETEKAAEGISKILKMKAAQKKKISQNAVKRAKDFDWRKVGSEMARIYARVGRGGLK